jgi:hypothetical protein
MGVLLMDVDLVGVVTVIQVVPNGGIILPVFVSIFRFFGIISIAWIVGIVGIILLMILPFF